MTTAAVTPSISPPRVQAEDQTQREKLKRVRPKNISWEAGDKLCQIRLFAAEDAPSLSSTVLQDLFEAKKTKFMHAVIPVSADDLPPGFEGVAAKRAKLDAEAIVAMVAQITWRIPERLVFDPTWLVATGNESSEVAAQHEREVRVLEAVYPRTSVIPPSPMELQDVTPALEEGPETPQVPLIPLEEEDDCGSDDDTVDADKQGSHAFFSQGPTPFLTRVSDSRGQSGDLVGNSSGSSSSSSMGSAGPFGDFLKSADPDVAAAAATAYAVIKAKESGALIDHDLLIKILSNPRLIETVVASNPGLKGQFGSLSNGFANVQTSNGSGFTVANGPSPLPSQVRQRMESLPEGNASGQQGNLIPQGAIMLPNQGWNTNTGPWLASQQGRVFNSMSNNQEKMLNGSKAIPGHPFKEMQGLQVQPFRHHPDLAKELIQHGIMGSALDTQLRHNAHSSFDETKVGQDLDRHQGVGLGPRGQPWIGSNQSVLPAYARSNSISQNRPVGGPGAKIKKPCLFYNTPRGCRKGLNCDFVHDTEGK